MRHDQATRFELAGFLPYLLNQAAEAASAQFQERYRARFGMLRTEWRVMFHLARYGAMTATEIGRRARIHKTKISRAVRALEAKRFLTRVVREDDRRVETLTLSKAGLEAFRDLETAAKVYDQSLWERFSEEEQAVLRRCLTQLAEMDMDEPGGDGPAA